MHVLKVFVLTQKAVCSQSIVTSARSWLTTSDTCFESIASTLMPVKPSLFLSTWISTVSSMLLSTSASVRTAPAHSKTILNLATLMSTMPAGSMGAAASVMCVRGRADVSHRRPI